MSLRKLLAISTLVFASATTTVSAKPTIDNMVVFGDSLSDVGNTTHLLKSLRRDEDPSYLVKPFKVFVVDKMTEYANDYHVPQMVLDAGIDLVSDFFDHDIAYFLTSIVSKIKMLPVVPGDPYYASRFSNGLIWNEHLAAMMNLKASDSNQYTNQAFGGSWAMTYDYQLSVWNMIRHPINSIKNLVAGKLIPPSLGIVTQTYLMMHKSISPNTAVFMFSGGNDYLNVLAFEDNYNPAIMSDYVDNVISSIESSTQRMINAGARHMVIFGVPDVGMTPKFVNTTNSAVLSHASHWHNQRLEERVGKWREKYPDVQFTYIDIEGMLKDVIDNPWNYGLTNVDSACIDVKLPKIMFAGFARDEHPFKNNTVLQYAQILQYRDKSFAPNEKNYHVCDNPDQYLFWDEVHPTARVHEQLAEKVCYNLQANGYEVKCEA